MPNSVFAHNIKRGVTIKGGAEILMRNGGSPDEIYRRIDSVGYSQEDELSTHPFCADTPVGWRERRLQDFDTGIISTDSVVKLFASYVSLSLFQDTRILKLKIIRVPTGSDGQFDDAFEFVSHSRHLLAVNVPNYSGAGSAANANLRSLFLFLRHVYGVDIEEVRRSRKLLPLS